MFTSKILAKRMNVIDFVYVYLHYYIKLKSDPSSNNRTVGGAIKSIRISKINTTTRVLTYTVNVAEPDVASVPN
jgi:hypothetical protein